MGRGVLRPDLAATHLRLDRHKPSDALAPFVDYFWIVRWDLRGQPKRKIFISRWNAYHGSTVAAASLGGMKHMHAQGDLPIPGIEHIMQPYKFGDGFGESYAVLCFLVAGSFVQSQNVVAHVMLPGMGELRARAFSSMPPISSRSAGLY